MTKKKSFVYGFLLIVIALSVACQQKKTDKTTYRSITTMQDSIVVVTFQPETGGWGYKIMMGSKNYIYQDVIPGIFGKHPFESKEDAEKVGNEVALRIKKGEQLPNLTIQDLKDMGIAGIK